jgi:hypothetical protein
MMFKARPINIHPFASTFTGNFPQPRALAAIGAADRVKSSSATGSI